MGPLHYPRTAAAAKPAGRLRSAVFLDRDGVINRSIVRDGKPFSPRHPDEFHYYPDTADAVHRLLAVGYAVVVVTNQPDIGNSKVSVDAIDAMHRRLLEELLVTAVFCCPHRREDACACRKPEPGMLREAAHLYDIDLQSSIMVGDRLGDIGAGRAAGCHTVFIRRNYDEPEPINPDHIANGLGQAVDIILSLWTPRAALA